MMISRRVLLRRTVRVAERRLATSSDATNANLNNSTTTSSSKNRRPKGARVGGVRTDGRTIKWYRRASVDAGAFSCSRPKASMCQLSDRCLLLFFVVFVCLFFVWLLF